MSVAKANKRKYKEDYIRYGVACLQKDEEYIPQGMLYMKTLTNNCLKSFQFKQHVNNAHKEQPSKIGWTGYFTVSPRKVLSNMSDWTQDVHLNK